MSAGPGSRLALAISTILAAGAIGVLTATSVLAYPPPATTGQLIAACERLNPGSHCVFEFKFLNSSGQAVSGDHVNFFLSGCSGCTLSATSGVTNSNGEVSVTVFTSSSTHAGRATLEAVDSSTPPVTVTASFTITAAAVTPLPATSAAPAGSSPWLYVVFGLGALVVIGGAVALRRTRSATV